MNIEGARTPFVRAPSTVAAVQAGAALAGAIGVGRFVFTPILPLMEAQAGLLPQDAGVLASANYLGYLVGAVLGIVIPRLGYDRAALRASGVAIVLSLALMSVTDSVLLWSAIRGVAGVASAVMFMVTGNAILARLSGAKPQLVGWAYGGLGIGIAMSGALVGLVSRVGDWRAAWWVAAGLSALFAFVAWPVGATGPLPKKRSVAAGGTRAERGPFRLLLVAYFLEGAGYIIAGTFLVAAVAEAGPQWLGGSVWLIVGISAVPSCVLWTVLAKRFSRPTLITIALVLQAIGIALPALSGSAGAAITAAVLFGATFMGIVMLTMSVGRDLGTASAVAILTAAYSIGQVVGPLAVIPLLDGGYRAPLLVGAGLVLAASLAAALIRVRTIPSS